MILELGCGESIQAIFPEGKFDLEKLNYFINIFSQRYERTLTLLLKSMLEVDAWNRASFKDLWK